MKAAIKKGFTGVLTLSLLFSAIFTAFDMNYVSAAGTAVITVDSVTAYPGDTVDIPVRLTENPGIAGFCFSVTYPIGLTLNNITKGDILESGAFSGGKSNRVIQWYNEFSDDPSVDPNMNNTGTLFTLQFLVAADASSGDYDIEVNLKDGVAANLTKVIPDSSNGENVPVTFNKGTITVKENDPVPVTEVSLDRSKLSLAINDTAVLTASVQPDNATDKTVTWTSSDNNVATVDNSGRITGVAKGTATITATANDGSGSSAVCVVTVIAPIPVDTVTFDSSSKSLYTGDSFTITPTISPADATDKSLTWKSSDPAVASVSDTGVVTAKGAGKATITATSSNGKSAECVVTVTKKSIKVTGVTVSPTSKSIYVDDTFSVTANISPSDADVKTVTWSSSNSSVAVVDNAGKVIGRSEGTADVMVTTTDGGFKAVCKVTVSARPAPTPTPRPQSYRKYIINNTGMSNAGRVYFNVSRIQEDLYLRINNSNGTVLRSLITGDSSLKHTDSKYYDISLTDEDGYDIEDFGTCTIRLPLPSGMDTNNGSIRVVTVLGGRLDKSISYSTSTDGGVQCVTFATTHFTDFAILYNKNSSSNSSSSSSSSSSTSSTDILRMTTSSSATGNALASGSTSGNSRTLDNIPRTGDR